MTSKGPTKIQKKWIMQILKKWRDRLLLNEWYFDVLYKEQDIIDVGYTTNTDITACPVYLKATIRIYPIYFTQSRDEQEKALIHELVHCLTQEVWDTTTRIQNGYFVSKGDVRDQCERLTQRITNAVYWKY